MKSTTIPDPVLVLSMDQVQKMHEMDLDQLADLWHVFTKCASLLESGRRLENLSWRLWFREAHALPPGMTLSDYNNLSTSHSLCGSPSAVTPMQGRSRAGSFSQGAGGTRRTSFSLGTTSGTTQTTSFVSSSLVPSTTDPTTARHVQPQTRQSSASIVGAGIMANRYPSRTIQMENEESGEDSQSSADGSELEDVGSEEDQESRQVAPKRDGHSSHPLSSRFQPPSSSSRAVNATIQASISSRGSGTTRRTQTVVSSPSEFSSHAPKKSTPTLSSSSAFGSRARVKQRAAACAAASTKESLAHLPRDVWVTGENSNGSYSSSSIAPNQSFHPVTTATGMASREKELEKESTAAKLTALEQSHRRRPVSFQAVMERLALRPSSPTLRSSTKVETKVAETSCPTTIPSTTRSRVTTPPLMPGATMRPGEKGPGRQSERTAAFLRELSLPPKAISTATNHGNSDKAQQEQEKVSLNDSTSTLLATTQTSIPANDDPKSTQPVKSNFFVAGSVSDDDGEQMIQSRPDLRQQEVTPIQPQPQAQQFDSGPSTAIATPRPSASASGASTPSNASAPFTSHSHAPHQQRGSKPTSGNAAATTTAKHGHGHAHLHGRSKSHVQVALHHHGHRTSLAARSHRNPHHGHGRNAGHRNETSQATSTTSAATANEVEEEDEWQPETSSSAVDVAEPEAKKEAEETKAPESKSAQAPTTTPKRKPVTFTMGDDDSDEDIDGSTTSGRSQPTQSAARSAPKRQVKLVAPGDSDEEPVMKKQSPPPAEAEEVEDDDDEWSSDESEEDEATVAQKSKEKREEVLFKKVPIRCKSAADVRFLPSQQGTMTPGPSPPNMPVRGLLSSIFRPETEPPHPPPGQLAGRPHASAADLRTIGRGGLGMSSALTPLSSRDGLQQQQQSALPQHMDLDRVNAGLSSQQQLPRVRSGLRGVGSGFIVGGEGGGLKASKSAVALPLLNVAASRSTTNMAHAAQTAVAEATAATRRRHGSNASSAGPSEAAFSPHSHADVAMSYGSRASGALHGDGKRDSSTALARLNELAGFRFSSSRPRNGEGSARSFGTRSSPSESGDSHVSSQQHHHQQQQQAAAADELTQRSDHEEWSPQLKIVGSSPDLRLRSSTVRANRHSFHNDEQQQQHEASATPRQMAAHHRLSAPLPVELPDGAAPQTPRTTRRNMLRDELSESLRQNLLWERQSRNRMLGIISGQQQAQQQAQVQQQQQQQQQQPSSMRKETVLGGGPLRPLTSTRTRSSGSATPNGAQHMSRESSSSGTGTDSSRDDHHQQLQQHLFPGAESDHHSAHPARAASGQGQHNDARGTGDRLRRSHTEWTGSFHHTGW